MACENKTWSTIITWTKIAEYLWKHHKNKMSGNLVTDGKKEDSIQESSWAFHGRFIEIWHVHGI